MLLVLKPQVLNPDQKAKRMKERAKDYHKICQVCCSVMVRCLIRRRSSTILCSIRSMESASLLVYEIIRVCLHANVSFSAINFPEPAILDDYNILWKIFKGVPAMDGKSFPERCSETI
jgi:hypothetical protein